MARFEGENLAMVQGEPFSHDWTWYQEDEITPVDLTGCSARMEVRPRPGDDVLLMAFDTAPDATEGSILLGDADGTITLSMDADLTAEETRGGYFDLFIFFGDGMPQQVISGKLSVSLAVTRV